MKVLFEWLKTTNHWNIYGDLAEMPIRKKLKALQKKVTKIVLTSINEIRNPPYQHYLHAAELLTD